MRGPDLTPGLVFVSRKENMSDQKSNEERALLIQALLREREGCERRGLTDRVKLINAELRRMSYEAEPPVERSEKRPATTGRQKRA